MASLVVPSVVDFSPVVDGWLVELENSVDPDVDLSVVDVPVELACSIVVCSVVLGWTELDPSVVASLVVPRVVEASPGVEECPVELENSVDRDVDPSVVDIP